MKRRSILGGIGTGGVAFLAGCLGDVAELPTDPSAEFDPAIDQTDDTSDTDASQSIDPDAHYVVRGPEGRFSAKGPWNTDLEGVVIHGYDLVKYFEAERPVEGSKEHEYTHDGVRFWFAAEEHRETFASDPEAYLPQFGGYCSLGVGNGYKDGMHPDAFDIIEGKLYFNLTPSIHEGWLRNYEERIETANRNWPEIKNSTEQVHIGPGLPG